MHDLSFGLLERPGLDSGYGFQAPGMLLKFVKIEHQGFHDLSFGLLERPGLDSCRVFEAQGTSESDSVRSPKRF